VRDVTHIVKGFSEGFLLEMGFDFATVFSAIVGSSLGRNFKGINIGLIIIVWLPVMAVYG